MSYLVFARKFRPQNFDEVIGQEPIVTTLKNAIKQERIPQNFLFSGPRGVGKTSTARILAKALNCQKGPTEDPCGKCPACVEITQGNSLDVLEIDGASNRGIDEIRNLRETVKYKPVTGNMKVYVIDEVHMLTTEAFNALLKTLEEPPPHVKFVFATTEVHKVPLTILSRCHRFHFKRIPTPVIAEKLEEIAAGEELKCDKKALYLIAKAGEGSLRDAEGLLDQMASFSEGKIKEEDVLLMLGLASEELFFSILTAIREKDAKRIFSMVSELYEGGRDLVQFAKGLLEIFRHLLLFQAAEGVEEFVELSDEGKAELKKRKDVFSRGELLLALSFLGNLQAQLRRNLAPPKLLLETTLLKLVHLDALCSVDELLAGQSLNPSSAPAASFPKKPAPSSWNAPAGTEAAPPTPNGPAIQANKTEIASSPAAPRPPAALGEPRQDSWREDGYVQRSVADNDKENRPHSVIASSEGAKQSPNFSATATAVAAPPAAQVIALEESWPKVIDYVKAKRMSTGIFLSESTPMEIRGASIILGLPAEFQFHKEMLEKETNRVLIEEAFEVVAGRKFQIEIVITQVDSRQRQPAAKAEDSSKLPEIITEALHIFEGAKIVRKD